MANSNSYEKFYSATKKVLKDTTTNLECLVNLESDEQVTKVLALNASGNVQSTESLNGEVTISGTVVLGVVYTTQSGKVGNATYSAPFTAKFIDAQVKPDSKVFAKVTNCEAKVDSITNNTAKIQCQVTLSGVNVENVEVNYLNQVEDNCCFKNSQVEYYSLQGVTKGEWTENLNLVVKEPVQKVLASFNQVALKSVEGGAGFVSLNYEVLNKLTYLTAEENSTIKTIYTKQDFKQEVESSYATKDSKFDVDLFVVAQNAKTTVEDNGEEVKITLEVPLQANICVYELNTVNTISDLFSTTNLTNVSTSSFENTKVCEPIVFEKKVEGNVTLSEDEPRIDKLLAVNYSKIVVINQYLQNGEYTVSGVINSNLIYFNEDEVTPCSVDVEIPFVVSTQTQLEGEYLTDLSVCAKDVDVMVKRGRDVFVDATLCVYVNVCQTTQDAVINQVEFKEEVPQKDCAIEIYFAKAGENVWDIAKKLYVKPELIYTQNPDLTQDTLENDTKLSLYYQKNRG